MYDALLVGSPRGRLGRAGAGSLFALVIEVFGVIEVARGPSGHSTALLIYTYTYATTALNFACIDIKQSYGGLHVVLVSDNIGKLCSVELSLAAGRT